MALLMVNIIVEIHASVVSFQNLNICGTSLICSYGNRTSSDDEVGPARLHNNKPDGDDFLKSSGSHPKSLSLQQRFHRRGKAGQS